VLAATGVWPWVGRSRVRAALATYHDLLRAARAAEPGALPAQPPDERTRVADLTDLQRRLFGLALALLAGPQVVVADDVSMLGSATEQRAWWAACRGAAALEPRRVPGRRTTVLAATSDTGAVPHDVRVLTLPDPTGAPLAVGAAETSHTPTRR